MTFEAWHGGRAHFENFSYDAIGSGEGAALGYGFYFSEHREGGEFFARYMNFQQHSGFLYRVLLSFKENELLNLDIALDEHSQAVRDKIKVLFASQSEEPILGSAYINLRLKLGNRQAALALLQTGIKVLRSDEGTKPGHGYTYLVLDREFIKIVDVYRFVESDCSWPRIGPFV